MKIKIDKELFQWEKNRKVNIEASSDEPVITVVEFYNPQSKVADAVEVENGEAEIPNYLLKVPYPIMAVACTGEIGNTQAVDRREFRVIKRLRPENYVDDGSSAPESPSTPPSSGGTSGGTGAPGKDGEDGATFIPYVSDEGILSWTNDKGLENPASVNIMGPKGEQGEVGPQGPQGETGPQGLQGETGPQGEAGVDGTDGYTPIKGVDYFTEDDKTEIVNQLSEKTYSKEEVDDKISKVNHLKRTIVSSSLDIDVTAENADQYVYMVPKSDSLTEDNYDEYMVIEGKIEKVGNSIPTFTGAPGKDGEDGRGIVSVRRTSGNGAAGTTDTYTITYTDNTTSTFTVYNGKDGVNGKDGKDGEDYVLTNEDKQEIAEMAAELVDVSDSGGNGEDGFSPIANVTQTATGAVISITDKDGTTTATITNGKDGKDGVDGQDGYTPVKGTDYFDGEDGQDGSPGKDGSDGVSATHSWNGTVLTVTSASGTSSADLKGPKGDTGEQGPQGEAGYTPARGTDYWTPADIAEIKNYVDEAILGGEW